MRNKIVSSIAAITLMALMLLVTVSAFPSVMAANSSQRIGNVSILGGQDALQLGTMIAKQTSPTNTINVLVISGLTNPTISQAVAGLQRGEVIVTIGESLFPTPTIHETSTTSTIQIDSKTGTVSSVTTNPQSADTVLNALHLITVAQQQGPTLHISFYGLQVDSVSQYQNMQQNAANEAAALSTPITTFSSATTAQAVVTPTGAIVTPLGLGDANGQWTKKYDVSYTYSLNGQGDYVYARFEIYQLNYWDTVSGKEYWRIDTAVDHLMKTYTCGGSHCGPYLNQRQQTIQMGSVEIYQYDPVSTNKDTTVQVGISFDVSSSGGGVSVSYSWSWTNPGVTYNVQAGRTNNKMNTQEVFNGPNYFYYPFSISGPTGGAYNSFQAEPTVVARTPYQSGINVQSLDALFETFNDQLSCNFLCITFNVARTWNDYHITYNPGQLNSMFAPTPTTIVINSCPTTDFYGRSHGLAWDQALPNPWWSPYHTGFEFTASSTCLTAPANTFTRTLSSGSHYVQYAASGSLPSYAWHAKIFVNGVLRAEADVGRANPLQANFSV